MDTPEGKKRKVLIVSFDFPPMNNIAAVRAGKFAKYLPRFGWEPIVLTADNIKSPQTLPMEANEANVFRAKSFTLGARVYQALGGEARLSAYSEPKSHEWRRVAHRAIRSLRPFYALPVVERLTFDPVGWWYYGVQEGQRIMRSNNVSAIFSSSNPPTAHFIACCLRKRARIPWVAEFRDPWVDPYDERGHVYEFIERRLEKAVLKRAEALIGLSEPNARLIESVHHKKAIVIPNGFDEGDYNKADLPLTPGFTMTYTGNIYPGKRDPTLVFQALSELQKERASLGDTHVRFFGGSSLKNLQPLIDRYGLNDIVKLYGAVPFQESISRQRESTILLLLEWDNPRAEGVYGGKIFEYLGAHRPILAIGCKDGVITRLLSETGSGILANKVEVVKIILRRWLTEWRNEGRIVSYWKPVESAIQKFTRQEQTRKLAQVLDEVTHGILAE